MPGFNLNGIEVTDRELVVVSCMRSNPTGESRSIDLGGERVTDGDGLLLIGRQLFVVRNQLNQIDVVKLSARPTSGEVIRTIRSSLFDVPTTVAKHGNGWSWSTHGSE